MSPIWLFVIVSVSKHWWTLPAILTIVHHFISRYLVNYGRQLHWKLWWAFLPHALSEQVIRLNPMCAAKGKLHPMKSISLLRVVTALLWLVFTVLVATRCSLSPGNTLTNHYCRYYYCTVVLVETLLLVLTLLLPPLPVLLIPIIRQQHLLLPYCYCYQLYAVVCRHYYIIEY